MYENVCFNLIYWKSSVTKDLATDLIILKIYASKFHWAAAMFGDKSIYSHCDFYLFIILLLFNTSWDDLELFPMKLSIIQAYLIFVCFSQVFLF